MLWVGMDTHYGLYDSGYRKKSFGIDTVGTCASSQQQFFSVVPVGDEINRRKFYKIIRKEFFCMIESTVRNYEDLPMFQDGSRIVVPRDKLIEWIERQTAV